MGRFVADHGTLDGGRAHECACGVIDEPGGRARVPGEGAVTPRGNLGQPGAFPAPLERRVREAGPAGGYERFTSRVWSTRWGLSLPMIRT